MSELVRFRRMFEPDAWANGTVLDARRLGPAPAKARSWIAHIVGSERLWLARIRHEPTIGPEYDANELVRVRLGVTTRTGSRHAGPLSVVSAALLARAS